MRAGLLVVLTVSGCVFDRSGLSLGDGAVDTARSERAAETSSLADGPADRGGEAFVLDGPRSDKLLADTPRADKLLADKLVPDKLLPDKLVPLDQKVCLTWTPKPVHFDPCTIPAPTAGLTLTTGTWTYNTDSNVLTSPSGATSNPTSAVVTSGVQLRVVSVQLLSVPAGSTLRAVGALPLLIASWSTTQIAGTVDVPRNGERRWQS
jgi:hypothetical protein